MSSSALWAALGAGTDTIATGISEERKAAKEAGLLAERRAYEEKTTKAQWAQNEKVAGAAAAARLAEATHGAGLDLNRDREKSKLNIAEDANRSGLNQSNWEKQQRALNEREDTKRGQGMVDDQMKLDNLTGNMRTLNREEEQKGSNIRWTVENGQLKSSVMTSGSKNDDYTIMKLDNGDVVRIPKKPGGQMEVVANSTKEIDPIAPIDDSTRTRLIGQFKDPKTGEWNNDFEDMVEEIETWWPKRTKEDKLDIPSAVMSIVRLQLDDNVPRHIVWEGIPEKYRSEVWPDWRKGDRIPILTKQANSNQTTGGRSAMANKIANKYGQL